MRSCWQSQTTRRVARASVSGAAERARAAPPGDRRLRLDAYLNVAESTRHLVVRVPWTTLLKVLAAIALVWLSRELVWLAMVVLVAIIIAVGLAPVVTWFERKHWPRWLAASTAVTVLVAASVGFLILTWSSVSKQSADLGQRLGQVEQEILGRTPQPVVDLLRRSDTQSTSIVAPYARAIGRNLLWFVTAFV